jgi:hypothetical protein
MQASPSKAAGLGRGGCHERRARRSTPFPSRDPFARSPLEISAQRRRMFGRPRVCRTIAVGASPAGAALARLLVGPDRVCKRIARRIRELGLPDGDTYRRLLEANPAEWQTFDRTRGLTNCSLTLARARSRRLLVRIDWVPCRLGDPHPAPQGAGDRSVTEVWHRSEVGFSGRSAR